MRRLGLHSLFLALLISLSACGKMSNNSKPTSSLNFKAGKDYEVISTSEIVPKFTPKAQVQVVEYFSYACSACYHFEPILEKWLANKPKYVKFERIPIVFQPMWRSLARAYYIAKMLGVEKKLTPALFKAIHVEGQDLSNPKLQEAFFIKQGIKQHTFESIASFSPGIDAQLLRSDTLMQKNKILAAPTLVIDNRYKVDPSMVGGNPTRFLQVTDYLIEKVRKGDE
ncbi:thiol:disulfide interchange protein DsbA/DsbL [Rickettsiella grylli]|uniref:Thiol:disulfide interchange protein n=1 Tax=Rickettsiella grylli TaxID=59196 RepID=A8PK39_9COXI|nr:thiol:disulfide interchange protein DsbA/DsbL [Rickettsiella grylli]EDP46110.1 thiol:disulfide interchange protein DsbA [Rickettsiella grylli]